MVKKNLEVVITSCNQGEMIKFSLNSVLSQTVQPKRVIIVDDGSTKPESLEVLRAIDNRDYDIEVMIHYQDNAGVSIARNKGIALTESEYVMVFDGDDLLKETYIEKVMERLEKNEAIVAASSWIETFGVLQSLVKPTGGNIVPFLSRNCCPATHIVRKSAWMSSHGYDESMKSGFEDWEYFLGILETSTDARIDIVEEPLMLYRTAPASSNIRSMEKRLDLMRYIINMHKDSYIRYFTEALLGIEKTSMDRLFLWEQEVQEDSTCEASKIFLENPSYGDGGMASAVRIAANSNNKI